MNKWLYSNRLRSVALLVGLMCNFSLMSGEAEVKPGLEFPFKNGDKVFWIGSSSTRIGVWCRTMEFLLRTRHPELTLSFERQTTGGGTFKTALEDLSYWLKPKPTLVFYNFGGNDASAGKKGLAAFKTTMSQCVQQALEAGARVILMTPQGGDARASNAEKVASRRLYGQTMIAHGHENGWRVIDTAEPLDALQQQAQAENPLFTINKDTIHLTDSAYVAWGYYLYQRLNPPVVESVAEISATGKLIAAKNCKITDIVKGRARVSFMRADQVLPLLPPDPISETLKSKPEMHLGSKPSPQREWAEDNAQRLPPRKYTPLEAYSRYMLKVTDLEDGDYQILCDDKVLGTASGAALAAGVNLNSVLLDSRKPAPWLELTTALWAGQELEKIGKTRMLFTVKKN